MLLEAFTEGVRTEDREAGAGLSLLNGGALVKRVSTGEELGRGLALPLPHPLLPEGEGVVGK
jgi:hypothetical protein